jgi:O-antigen/teichoic acid export membrane protein
VNYVPGEREEVEAEISDAAAATTGRSVARGGAWLLFARFVPQLQVLIVSVVAAHYLGPELMGRQSFISFVVGSVVILATAGLPGGLNRFVAELQGARLGGVARSLFWWTWRIEAVMATLAAAGIGLAALAGAEPQVAWIFAALACAFSVMQTVPAALLVGMQRWRQATIAGLTTGVLSIPATIAVLAAGGGITGFFVVEAAMVLFNLIWIAALGRRALVDLPAQERVPDTYRRDFIRFAGATTLFSVIELVVWKRSEFVFLAAYSTDAQIALYSIAFAATNALTRMPEVITAVAMPAVATLAGAGQHDRIRSGYWRGLRMLILVTPVVAFGAAALGPEALEAIYGSDYSGVRPVFLILMAPLLVMPLLSMTQAVLYALGKLRFLIVVGFAATAVNIGLAFVLISAFDAVGAALSNTGAQLAAGIPGLIYVGRMLGPVGVSFGGILRSLGTAGLMGGAAFGALALVGGVPGVFVGLVVGGLVLLAAGRILKPLTAGDAEWVEGLGEHPLLGVGARWFSSAEDSPAGVA